MVAPAMAQGAKDLSPTISLGVYPPSSASRHHCQPAIAVTRPVAGPGVERTRELRQLREENRKLKTMVADLSLDKHILQEVHSKEA
jgi:hypothetical protein